jgi:hypothetical protein
MRRNPARSSTLPAPWPCPFPGSTISEKEKNKTKKKTADYLVNDLSNKMQRHYYVIIKHMHKIGVVNTPS